MALDGALKQLRSHVGEPIEALEQNVDKLWAVERGLQLCAQNCIDIATHLVASAGSDVADYASAIDTLGSIGVVPPTFAAQFRAIAGFRNVLVHSYLAVDLDRVHNVLNERLDDFVEFARHIESYLSRDR